MKLICNYHDCTGCSACQNSCPHGAIAMHINEVGFLYPDIDKVKCTDCGLCRKICPQNNDRNCENRAPYTYLCWDNDIISRLNSSSGGFFSVIARFVLREGGIVCGAAYDDEMLLKHSIIEKECDLHKLQGSKYIQSEIGDSYESVKKVLKVGRWVYFVGTPCQVAGLKAFLRHDYDTLITSDLICHGVPSAKLFLQQIRSLEKKYKSKITDFKFRSKKRFGQGYDCEVHLNSGYKKFLCAELIPYFYGFWYNLTLRESCYQCKYANVNRTGDITLGDFWLVKRVFPDVKTSKGTSLILVNTPKGEMIFEKIRDKITYRETTLVYGVMGQGQLQAPVNRPAKRDNYQVCDLESLQKDILKIPLSYKFKMHTRNFLKLLFFYKYWK